MLKKLLTIVLLLAFTMTCCYAAETKKPKSPYKVKQLEVHTKDHHILKAKLTYPKNKDKSVKYPVVILLHSLGYSSSHWGNLPELLLKQNYAVLTIDLRGHGLSTKDEGFRVKSWIYYNNKTFQKYPSDVIAVINEAKSVKKVLFNKYSIVGGDIGANTAVLVAEKMYPKPQALVLLSPTIEQKGLTLATLNGHTPIGNIGNTPILVMCSKNDKYYVNQEMLLKKFANSEYIINNVKLNKNGMLIAKYDPNAAQEIIKFINSKIKK